MPSGAMLKATPAMWDPDELMLSMQQTVSALDASGAKRLGCVEAIPAMMNLALLNLRDAY